MWTKEEDQLLRDIVANSHKMTWKGRAEQLSLFNPAIRKTGKQCRERYRNYLADHTIKKPLTKDEKILFILLHSKYGNLWRQIASFYPQRNDLAMKNFFYSYVRKVLKKICNRFNNVNLGSNPWKLLGMSYIIDLVNHDYLPKLHTEEFDNSPQGITILTVIKNRGVDENLLARSKTRLIQRFRRENNSEEFPMMLELNSVSFCWNALQKEILSEIIERLNTEELSKLLTIKITESLEEQHSNISAPSLKESAYAPLQPLPGSLCLVPENPPCPPFSPFFQTAVPLYETPAQEEMKKMVNMGEGNQEYIGNFRALAEPNSIPVMQSLPMVTPMYMGPASYPLYSCNGFYVYPKAVQMGAYPGTHIREREIETLAGERKKSSASLSEKFGEKGEAKLTTRKKRKYSKRLAKQP